MKRLYLASERVKRGFTPQYMADALEVSINSYYKYESGEVNIPLSKAQKIAVILGCTLDHIFPIEERR